MEKHLLEQYAELLKERHDIQERIRKIEKRLKQIEEKGYVVSDSVTCGKRGKKPLGTKVITGFPFPEWDALQIRLRLQKVQFSQAEKQIDKIATEVEDYIQGVDDSRMRRIMRYKYLDNLSWPEVARRMGGKHTADGCRMAVGNYLKNKK